MSDTPPPDLWDIALALLISITSGIIAISNRILGGQEARALWIISEFLTAILCGYLMYNAYPLIAHNLPVWFTLPVAVALSAHIGGRLFQQIEQIFIEKYLAVINAIKPGPK